MMLNGIIRITRMTVHVVLMMMFRRLIAVHPHHRNLVVLHGRTGDRHHLVGEAGRGSIAER